MKKKILIFVDWYLPGYKAGGPIRSIAGLVSHLSGEYHLKIITANTDHLETIPYPDITPNTWYKLENDAEVFYCSSKFSSYENFRKIILSEKPDILYLNSMFSYRFTMLPMIIGRKYVPHCKIIIAPRGMLSRGSRSIKPFKKKVFLFTSKMIGFFNKVTFHASTTIEEGEIRSVFGEKNKIMRAMNLVPKSDLPNKKRIKNSGEVRLIYLGRISGEKNLLQALQMLQQTDPKYTFHYDIYGPPGGKEYYDQCIEFINQMPSHVHVHYKGQISNDKIPSLLGNYHFLYLLTKNENFGHAIVESLTAGCPAIISDQTPWRQLYHRQCGWDLILSDSAPILAALHQSVSMNQAEYDHWSEAAYNFAKTIRINRDAIRDHIRMFEQPEKSPKIN